MYTILFGSEEEAPITFMSQLLIFSKEIYDCYISFHRLNSVRHKNCDVIYRVRIAKNFIFKLPILTLRYVHNPA